MVVNGKKELVVEEPCKNIFMSEPSSPVLKTLSKCNSFFIQGLTSLSGRCRPLVVNGRQIGMLRPDVAFALLEYSNVFTATPGAFYLNPELNTYESRTEAFDIVLRDLRTKRNFSALRGWREECFNVWADFGTEPLFKIERSAVTLLGIRGFGISIVGYTRNEDGSMAVWVQKRSATKPTWPGMLDSLVSGGITAGLKPSQVVVKEAAEEASIPDDLIRNVVPSGTVSFYAETERGLHANTEFVYELELPRSFVPKNADGEVEGFELIPVQELLDRVLSSKYKLTSVPIAVDFLVRHGFINSDTEPDLPAVQELLHLPLHQFYKQWPLFSGQTPPTSPPPPFKTETPNPSTSLCFES